MTKTMPYRSGWLWLLLGRIAALLADEVQEIRSRGESHRQSPFVFGQQ